MRFLPGFRPQTALGELRAFPRLFFAWGWRKEWERKGGGKIRDKPNRYSPSISDLKLNCLPNPFLIIPWTGFHLTSLSTRPSSSLYHLGYFKNLELVDWLKRRGGRKGWCYLGEGCFLVQRGNGRPWLFWRLWCADVVGRMSGCPAYLGVVINNRLELDELFRYDLLILCPTDFNLTFKVTTILHRGSSILV